MEQDLEALDILQEECAELIQACSKIRRFGWDSSNPFHDLSKTNRDHLIEEIGDVLAVIGIVCETYDLDEWKLIQAKNAKIMKLKTWSTLFHNEYQITSSVNEDNSIFSKLYDKVSILVSRFYNGV